jgi:hypothetical protein
MFFGAKSQDFIEKSLTIGKKIIQSFYHNWHFKFIIIVTDYHNGCLKTRFVYCFGYFEAK